MMSLSSHCDATTTSDEPARPRGVRPGPETPAPGGFLCRPDLLERRPVIGRPLRAQEPWRVRPLEPEVHLQPAVVGPAAVPPAALVAVDAEELGQMRRPLGEPPGGRRPPLPEPHGSLDIGDAHPREQPAL